jgi:hypothetical protein
MHGAKIKIKDKNKNIMFNIMGQAESYKNIPN